MAEIKEVKFISPKPVLEIAKAGKIPVPKAREKLFIVYGVANGLIAKPSQYDADQMGITGRFEAIRASDQQRFSAHQLYLPGDSHDILVNALKPNLDSGLIPELRIAFEIGYEPGDTKTGYQFYCNPVLDTQTQDALAETRKQVDGMLAKLLPAPKAK
jgi:hypothetical protein